MKRLLGETNFEVKSLVLFGLGLTILATITFALYWWQTSSLVSEANRQAARQMIPAIILAHHWKWDQDEEMKPFGETIEDMVQDTLPEQLAELPNSVTITGSVAVRKPQSWSHTLGCLSP